MAQNTIGYNQEFPIYNADGTPFNGLVLKKSTADSIVMSLGDKVTGDVYYRDNSLVVNMNEYIVVNGVKYTIVNPPTIVREGTVSDNGQLKGMTKYSFEFYHPMYMLGNMPFSDIAVNSDQAKYLSQDKTFSWIGTLFDFIDKLNANLKNTQWTVEANIQQYEQDGVTVTPQWQKATNLSDVLPFDKNFISDALKTAYDTWEIPFVISVFDGILPSGYSRLKWVRISEIHQSVTGTTSPFWLFIYNLASVSADNRKVYYCKVFKEDTLLFNLVPCLDSNNNAGLYDVVEGVFYGSTQEVTFVAGDVIGENKAFNITFGLPTNKIYDDQGNEYVFRFGQGLGLKNNSRTPKNNKIVTRLAGYGAERNVPYGYPQIPWTGNQEWKYTINNAEGMQPIEIGGQTVMAMSYPIYDGIVGGQPTKLIKHPFTRKTLMPSIFVDTVNKKVNPLATGYDHDTEIKDYYDADSSCPNPINLLAPSFETHGFEDIYPRLGDAQLVGVYPYDEREYLSAVAFHAYIIALLPFCQNENEKLMLQQCYDYACDSFGTMGDFVIESNGGSYTGKAVGKYHEYADSYWYDVKFTSDHYNFQLNVYMGDVSPATFVTWDDSMNDDGEYAQSYFKIRLPQLTFDIYACASVTEEMQINMRSGDCLGCTFPVQVDWDDYKKNFYKSDGTFDPVIHTQDGDGHVRDGSKYPDSSAGQIDIIVKKDLDTFGKLMPNIYQQPKANDKFVVLGISLPTSYITSAQTELDSAMREYILENNVYYYEYPLKFDEFFLATHQNILAQIKNNNVVKFQYAGTEMSLYIKQITVKYGDKVLPQYDITLTDDVEIVLNKIGQVTDDVSRMRVQMSELQKYLSDNLIQEINNKLSRVIDDVCLGRITFQQGLDAIGRVILSDEIRSDIYENGLYTGRGWRIDELGNAELESLRVRSYIEVVEMLINRMQAQEGDTLFSDNDQIDKVDKIVDAQSGTTSYILSLKQKYEGYFTSQMYGNVIKGIINTLAAKQAGVSDETQNQPQHQGSDDGGNKYYTSWMRVIGTNATEPQTLGVNQIRVVLYGDNDVPSQRNFEPCELMTIARWGCFDYSDPSEPNYATVKASIIRRQRMFMISVSDGRVVKYTGVDSPMLRNGNYGVTIGELPEFVKNYPDVRAILNQVGEHTDWLYAQGVVVGNFVKVSREGLPIPTTVFCGDWIDGNRTEPLTIQIWDAQQQRYVDHVLTFPIPSTEYSNPESLYIGHGIYFYNQYNALTQQYETHRVRHNGGTWSCLQSQPVVIGGVATYNEPTWGSHYWNLIDAYDQLRVEIESSMGEVFNEGAVATTLTPTLKCGNVDITSETQVSDWKWERRTESGSTSADTTWNENHTGVRILNVTTQDMPAEWSESNKAIFTASVTISTQSGRSITVEND